MHNLLIPVVNIGMFPDSGEINLELYPKDVEIKLNIYAIGDLNPNDYFPNPDLKKK